MRIGIIGCGNICQKAYIPGIKRYTNLELVALADLDVALAQRIADEHDVAWAGSVADLLARDEVEAVVNLTIPGVHAAVDQQIIAAGKHVFSEKPLALSASDGAEVLAAANAAGVRVGCAPDTVLGLGTQTARAAIDAGTIGRPTSCTAFMAGPGHESWHPSPEFYYQAGGGPLYDMGPYYLTSLVTMLGPITEVVGFSSRALETRTITSEPKAGTEIAVEVDTHISASLRFASGVIGTAIFSFDVQGHNLPRLEVHGTEGSLVVPDPNRFDGEVQVKHDRKGEWVDIEPAHAGGARGLGLAEMAAAIVNDRPHRASGDLALHVTEVMDAILEAGRTGTAIRIQHQCERPAAMPKGLADDEAPAN